MTRITFLFGASNRLVAIADWLARRKNASDRVVVLTPEKELQDALDRLLWTRNALGFTPHCRAESPLATDTPIVLTQNLTDPPHQECLLNFSDTVPDGFSQFSELIEVVSTDEQQRTEARERFRFYKSRGYPLESIDISGAEQ